MVVTKMEERQKVCVGGGCLGRHRAGQSWAGAQGRAGHTLDRKGGAQLAAHAKRYDESWPAAS